MDQLMKCHYEGHLNSPITDDEVNFILFPDREFLCSRHCHLINLFKTSYKNILPFSSYDGCPWLLIEDCLLDCKIENLDDFRSIDLTYFAESAMWNLKIHHYAYYGVSMDLKDQLENITKILRKSKNQKLFQEKQKVEFIKSLMTEREQFLGRFQQISKTLFIEKELTIIQDRGQYYLFPTTMVICCMDNIQTRFYIRFHIEIKAIEEKQPALVEHYDTLHTFLKTLRASYGKKFFELMKNWDAYVIGHIVSDDIDDMGFTVLRDSLYLEFKEILKIRDLDRFLKLITCERFERDRDQSSQLALYFSNLSKNYGHPILNPIDGIKKLRENSKKTTECRRETIKKALMALP